VPPAIAIVGFLPLLSGRHPARGLTPAGAVGSVGPEVLVLVLLVGLWVRYRERMSAWWRSAMDEARDARRGPAGAR